MVDRERLRTASPRVRKLRVRPITQKPSFRHPAGERLGPRDISRLVDSGSHRTHRTGGMKLLIVAASKFVRYVVAVAVLVESDSDGGVVDAEQLVDRLWA